MVKSGHKFNSENKLNSSLLSRFSQMKYIEKSRLEKFLNFKGYKIEPTKEIKTVEKSNFSSWTKSTNEKINLPKREVFNSFELPDIFKSQELLNEFRKF